MFTRQLDYLVALDRERNFRRAAAACHVSQPALSAAIRSLEAELGVPLVRRSRRFEGFTPEGERVLVWARRALADLHGLQQDVHRMRSGLEGMLQLGAIPTSLPASTLITTRFLARHPRMRIRLRSMSSREIANSLSTVELHAGLTYLDNEPIADVASLSLWQERYLLVVPAATFAGAVTVSWAQAATIALCLLTPDMQHRRIVDDAFHEAGVSPVPAVETNSISTLIAHARTGIPGITAQAWLATNPLPAGMRAIPLIEPVVERTIGLVATDRTQRSPVVAELFALFTPFELDDAVTSPVAFAAGGA